MKIGYLTQFNEQEVIFASETGFACLELQDANPDSRSSVVRMSKEELRKIKDTFSRHNIRIFALTTGLHNHLHPDKEKRRKVNDYFLGLIEATAELGVKVLTTNAWGDPNKTVEENLPDYKQVFTEYAKRAQEKGIKIALENCPHLSQYPYKIGNIAYSPEIWERLFDAIPSEAIGLEFDPSHLFWLGIDYIKPLYEFKDRIYSVHAKDTEILEDNLARKGIFGSDWWRYRIPGWDRIDWKRFISAVYDIEYAGDLIIEHEDPIFSGEKRRKGLELGYRYLSQFTY